MLNRNNRIMIVVGSTIGLMLLIVYIVIDNLGVR